MTDKKDDSSRPLWSLGAAITLPTMLVSGPLAGFLVGQYLLVGHFELSSIWVGICIGLGFLASALQTYKLIKRIKDSDS